MTANVAASIRARLLNKARNIGSEFELFLVRYACERFLYRLGESVERERCILKGQPCWLCGWRSHTELHVT